MPFHTPEEQAGQQQPQQQDLGQSLAPQQQAGASPSFRNAVDGFFQDPVNRAGLLSFGLNMLSGGFGTPLQQFAHAAGQGIESAAGAGAFQASEQRKDEQQDFQERQLGQRASLSREKDAAALERTLVAAKARIQTAGLSGTSLANKALSQAGSEYTAVSRTLRQNQLINNLSEEEIQGQAQAAAQNKLDTILGITESAFPGSTQSAIPGGGTRPNPAGAAPPAQPPPGASAPVFNRPNAAEGSRQLVPFDQFRQNIEAQSGLTPQQKAARIQQMEQLKLTPQGQQKLRDGGVDPGPGPQTGLLGQIGNVAQFTADSADRALGLRATPPRGT